MTTIHTFGDSILDCGGYNAHGINPGQLLAQNDNRRFPEFRGRDLVAYGVIPTIAHHAVDGATAGICPPSPRLRDQLANLEVSEGDVAILTIGGNDLLHGLAADGSDRSLSDFERSLRSFITALPIRPVLIGNVYDPTFGDDRKNFLGIDPEIARANHGRVNAILGDVAGEVGLLVDLHSHFLSGDASWYTHIFEPSLDGASEVRRAFLAYWENGQTTRLP